MCCCDPPPPRARAGVAGASITNNPGWWEWKVACFLACSLLLHRVCVCVFVYVCVCVCACVRAHVARATAQYNIEHSFDGTSFSLRASVIPSLRGVKLPTTDLTAQEVDALYVRYVSITTPAPSLLVLAVQLARACVCTGMQRPVVILLWGTRQSRHTPPPPHLPPSPPLPFVQELSKRGGFYRIRVSRSDAPEGQQSYLYAAAKAVRSTAVSASDFCVWLGVWYGVSVCSREFRV
jgi:hypothetical protein